MRPHADHPPPSEDLRQGIKSAIGTLHGRLSTTDLDAIPLSDYSRRYLRTYREDLGLALRRYGQLITWSLEESPLPLGDNVFLEYGGGTGIMSMLAKAAGVGTVVYNDIYDVSCDDARTLATEMGAVADHYVQGDIGDVAAYLGAAGIRINAVASFDVIEHIYDISGFFSALTALTPGPLSITMSTGANPYNPLIVRALRRVHHEAEHVDSPEEEGRKERDATGSYLSIRREMIRGIAPELEEGVVERLARATRGLREEDIRAAVTDCLASGRMPSPSHPTNTCDPFTGNWAEQLMDLQGLRDQLRTAGFRAELRFGPYEETGAPARASVKRALNRGIPLLGELGRYVAPSVIIHGRRD